MGLASEVDVAVIGAGCGRDRCGAAAGRGGRGVGSGAGRARARRRARLDRRVPDGDADGSRVRMAAFGRPQRARAARRAARLFARPAAAGLDDAAAPQRRERGGRSRLAARARGALLGDPPRRARTEGPRRPRTVLEPGGRWNALLDAISTWANAVELENLSVKDNDRYEDTGINWRVRDGLRPLFAALGRGSADRVRRRGVAGRSSRRRASASRRPAARSARRGSSSPCRPRLIAGEHLAFDPTLAGQARGGCRACRSGLANKLFLALRSAFCPAPTTSCSWSARPGGARR